MEYNGIIKSRAYVRPDFADTRVCFYMSGNARSAVFPLETRMGMINTESRLMA